ncbi:hypothetical protein K438DRAFT_2016154 [Mycena galopus ATCC 62051]|nr:hypothetical protein K438DRAFT_2016154 [Mycena galopus ATCC 62051]
MASRATDNLRTYFRKAILPEMVRDSNAPKMPPPGQCSHHVNIQVAPEHWRQLLEIRTVEAAWGISLEAMAVSWIDNKIPKQSLAAEDLDSETGECFTVPCGPTFNIPPHIGRRPTDIMRVVPWIDYLPLMTVQRTLHLLFPQDTAKWNFSLVVNDDERERKLFRHFLWSYSGPGKPMVFTRLAISLATIWSLHSSRRGSFLNKTSLSFASAERRVLFPPFSPTDGNSTALEAKERLWAKIWDTCVTAKTRWFVLTSYNHWVFGTFSEAWTIGFVSDVYCFDACAPSILELLMFWVVCAMRLPGWRDTPKVREPLTSGPPCVPVSAKSNA